jgi:hypothetical protein
MCCTKNQALRSGLDCRSLIQGEHHIHLQWNIEGCRILVQRRRNVVHLLRNHWSKEGNGSFSSQQQSNSRSQRLDFESKGTFRTHCCLCHARSTHHRRQEEQRGNQMLHLLATWSRRMKHHRDHLDSEDRNLAEICTCSRSMVAGLWRHTLGRCNPNSGLLSVRADPIRHHRWRLHQAKALGCWDRRYHTLVSGPTSRTFRCMLRS